MRPLLSLALLLPLTASAGRAAPGDPAIPPPREVRAAEVPPVRLGALDRDPALRVWWNVEEGREVALIEALIRDRWEVIGRASAPGFETRRLPPGTAVRVRWEGGVPSDPVVPQRGLGAPDVAALSGAGLPGEVVADLSASEDGAWVALLEGGLARVSKGDLKVRIYGRTAGLPSNQVNAAAVGPDGVAWVGTSRGLARIRGGVVERIWTRDDALPDDWVQALAVAGDETWVGTYRGLARVRGAAVEQVLTPWSVFSITAADDRLLAGYSGLRTLPDGALLEGVDEQLNVWDVDAFPPRLYLATDREGILRLEAGLLSPWWVPADGAVYALERSAGRLWAAAGGQGLVELSDASGPVDVWDEARGLPSGVVYEVVEGPPGKLWVGTTRGLALLWPEHEVSVSWPVAPAASGQGFDAVWSDGRRALLGGDEGVVAIGAVPRRWREVLAVPGPVLGLVPAGRRLWIIGQWDAWVAERGSLRRLRLPAEAAVSAAAAGTIWVGGPAGLHYYDAALDRFMPGPRVGAVTALAAQGGALWAVADGRLVAVESGLVRPLPEAGWPLSLAPAPEGVWIGTANGLALIDPVSGERLVERDTYQPVPGLVRLPTGRVLAALEDGELVDAEALLAVPGTGAAAEIGALRSVSADGRGRLWVLGDEGIYLLSPGNPL